MNVTLLGLIAGGHSGVPRYAAKLLEALDAVSPGYRSLTLSVVTTESGAETIAPHNLRMEIVAGRGRRANAGPGRILLEQWQARRASGDLLHFFDTSGPVLAPRRPFVTTFHDAAPIHGFRRFHNTYKLKLFPWALTHARAVVAVSQFAKDEAVQYFGTAPGKIEVIHSGPGLGPAAATAREPRNETDEPFLLYVGNIGVNKNLPLLIRVYHGTDVAARLVLAGNPREGASDVIAAIRGGRRARDIEVVERPSDVELDRLYRTAVALVLPSTYEGFGFTPLEAMARGCPVLASDIPAVREIAGDGALLIEPNAQADWADAIRRIIADDALRDQLRRRGDKTVRRYSWEKTAHALMRVFERALAGR
ncbi:MAG: glycosyltransferase family 4 protein [Actinobacteria bacterium]|nr:glycosyltransferase family 4 protein [Actinomycetota bacterium]